MLCHSQVLLFLTSFSSNQLFVKHIKNPYEASPQALPMKKVFHSKISPRRE